MDIVPSQLDPCPSYCIKTGRFYNAHLRVNEFYFAFDVMALLNRLLFTAIRAIMEKTNFWRSR
jgi:hypothetical protein